MAEDRVESKAHRIIGLIIRAIKNLFTKGFFHILTGNFLNKAISMISSIVVVRLVDKVVYADFAYSDNLYSYIALASGLGMSNALLKFCSASQDKETDLAYLSYAMKIGGGFELIAALLLCILVTFIEIPYHGARLFAWAFLLYPFMDYFVVSGTIYMRTQLENKKYAYLGVVKALLMCSLTITCVLIFGTFGIIPARYLAVLITSTYVVYYYLKIFKNKKAHRLTQEQKKRFLKVGLSLGVAGFFSGIMPINESFLVNNIIKDPIITSNFRVAGLLPQLLFLVSGAITVYYFPIVARMKDTKQIKKSVLRVALVNAVIILALTALGILLTPLTIRILYGDKYVDSVQISYLLWIMRASNCVIRMVPINMLPAIGKTKFNLYMSIISCFLQCVIDYYCIQSFGINGVAIGATIVYILSGVAYWLYFLHCCKAKEIKMD